jgi:hypothetical protein
VFILTNRGVLCQLFLLILLGFIDEAAQLLTGNASV